MRDIYEKILNNEQEFKHLTVSQFSCPDGITRDTIYDVLRKRGEIIRVNINETNTLIKEHITPYLKDPATIDEQIAQELIEFAESLLNYKKNIDAGLSYEIRHALSEYALKIKNDELFIENKFFEALCLFYLDTQVFKEDRNNCYEQIIAYADRYKSFSKPTRNFIARAFGNYYTCISTVINPDLEEIYRRYDLALSFWDNPAKVFDPDFPWEAFYLNLHENLCATTLSFLRSDDNCHLVKKHHLARLHQSALYLYSKHLSNSEIKSNDYTSGKVRYAYFLYSAEYHMGYITLNELLDFFHKVYAQSSNDYSYDTLFIKFQISAIYLYYARYIPDEVLISYGHKDKINKLINEVAQYAMDMPGDISGSHVTNMFTNFAHVCIDSTDKVSHLNLLLSLTVFRHPPTYAHSVMVARITYIITKHLVKYYPEKFIGIPSINCVEDVKTNYNELKLFVWTSGLIHDLGKIVYSHIVSFYGRNLNDYEFKIIQHHPSSASSFLKESTGISQMDLLKMNLKEADKDNPMFACFLDIARGHHKSFDGKFGYPKEFDNTASPVKFVIDILTIADTIDAATDSIGRSYAREVTLANLKDDVLSQVGTRYCPFIANEVFNNKELFDAIQDVLTNYRYDVYYSCFDRGNFLKNMQLPT